MLKNALMSMTEQEKEALKRMVAMGIFDEAVRQFAEEGLINVSEPPYGVLYWADESLMAHIRKFEEQTQALVYFVIRSYSSFGKMDSFLFVPKEKNAWAQERELMRNNIAYAFVYNHDFPQFSEVGTIQIQRTIGSGLVRVDTEASIEPMTVKELDAFFNIK